MVAAGVGANAALELYVLSQGRYHPQNFPDVTEFRILQRSRRDRTCLPRVEAAARYRQYVAHHDHRPRRLLLVDERELHAFSFAKKAAAFFNISRSISRRFTRVRNSL